MMEIIKCKVCGKELHQITNTHLKTHNITPQEYKNMFPETILKIKRNNKGIWDKSIGKYKYIKHPDRPKVKCMLCNKDYYRISHTHMQMKHQINLEDYKEIFPNKPLYITTDTEKELISKNHADVSGKNNPMYGIILPEETIKQNIKKSKNTINKKHTTEKWLNVECSYCNNKFHRSPYHINKTNFCSRKCQKEWYSENRRGSNNSNWNNGSSKLPYGPEFTEEFKKVIKYRDDFKCRMCKSNKDLVIHHIDYNKMNNNESNLITLCKFCHGKTNGHREIFMRLFSIGEFDYLNGGV